MTIALLVCALYCLADLFLYLRFNIRLQPSHFFLLSSPSSFWSSGKSLLLPFVACALLLFFFPFLALGLVLFTKWPHPFLTAYREMRKKKPVASFPISFSLHSSAKLFDIDTRDNPHILFISLESFRAKNVGCLDAKIPLSPHFDALAEKGLLFSQFHSTGNLTNRTIIASLFGVPPADQPWHLGQYCDLALIGLPQIFKNHGYHPAVIQGGSTAFDHEAEFFGKKGFQTILGKRDLPNSGTSWGAYDEFLMPYAASWLEKQTKPVFLNLYTITNHHPWIHPQKKPGFLNTFAYTDWALHLFMEELKSRRLLEKSILFIFGDHGQELEDRDPRFEINRHLYQDNIHTPLLIYAEGRIKKPKKISTVSSQIDLLPTVLDLMNWSDPHQSLGKSLLRNTSSPVFFSHPFDEPKRGCREENWKYLIQEGREELYNLDTDPEETINRIDEGTPLREKTKIFFESLDQFYSDQPLEKRQSPLHLDFNNSLQLNDAALEEIAKKNPHLSSISLEYCLMLTDCGIKKLLQHCPQLEQIFLRGQDELTGADWAPAPHLLRFKAIDCPQMQIDWIASLPALRILELGLPNLTDQDLFLLADKQTHLNAICLKGLYQITNQGVKRFLEKNESLEIASICECPQITEDVKNSIKSKTFQFFHHTQTAQG